ncbi:GTP-binding protein [Thermocrinis minervae]|uniref:Mutual gliding-motility protein MglA n=1 Tax=Thermocrinis minervae TaxID=381751 RepID=A0A1M6RAQ4_9AQUI|nr:GTP-binding protein [Thermocrinis minervae]SHK29417.1 hypothetical protein SAMN05444391_0569 [Thermocrinis minervae]
MIVDIEKKIVKAKIVYYGPPQSGKTTNLEKLSEILGLNLLKIDTSGDRTLVFDFATRREVVNGITVSFALYTVPGQEIYKDIRLTVLRGVDALVFVADAQKERLRDNLYFYDLLKEDLRKVGKSIENLPIVLQYNKMDLPNSMNYESLEEALNKCRYTSVCASAIRGEGVQETLDLLINQYLMKIGVITV